LIRLIVHDYLSRKKGIQSSGGGTTFSPTAVIENSGSTITFDETIWQDRVIRKFKFFSLHAIRKTRQWLILNWEQHRIDN